MSTRLWYDDDIGLTVTAVAGPSRQRLLELAAHDYHRNPRFDAHAAARLGELMIEWSKRVLADDPTPPRRVTCEECSGRGWNEV